MPTSAEVDHFLRDATVFCHLMDRVLGQQAIAAVTDLGLNPTTLNLLRMLSRDGAMDVGSVANFLGVSYPAASRTVDRLVRMSLAQRSDDPGDRRVTRVRATARGTSVVRDYDDYRRTRAEDAMSSLDGEDLQGMGRVLREIVRRLTQGKDTQDRHLCLQCACFDPGICLRDDASGCAYLERVAQSACVAPEVETSEARTRLGKPVPRR